MAQSSKLNRKKLRNVCFEVSTAMTMKYSVLWDVTPCSPVKIDRHSGGKYCDITPETRNNGARRNDSFLGNGSINKFSRQRTHDATMEESLEDVCSMRSVPRPPAESTESCRHGLVVRESPTGKDVSTEAEELPLLGTVTRQLLVNTTTYWDLACPIMICKVCRLVRDL
jgi:hypothetical protein